MSLSATTRNNCCICSCESAPWRWGVKSSEGLTDFVAEEELSLSLPASAALDGAEVRASRPGSAGVLGPCWPRTQTPASRRNKMGHSFPITTTVSPRKMSMDSMRLLPLALDGDAAAVFWSKEGTAVIVEFMLGSIPYGFRVES